MKTDKDDCLKPNSKLYCSYCNRPVLAYYLETHLKTTCPFRNKIPQELLLQELNHLKLELAKGSAIKGQISLPPPTALKTQVNENQKRILLEECSICKLKVKASRLAKHKKRAHKQTQLPPIPTQEPKTETCPYCDRPRLQGNEFIQHLAKFHPNLEVKCNGCAAFIQASNYSKHKLSCSANKLVQCSLCKDSFDSEIFPLHLKWHQRSEKSEDLAIKQQWRPIDMARRKRGKYLLCRQCESIPIPGSDLCYQCQANIK